MGIDRTLVRGMTQGLAGVLFSGLAIDGPGAFERCRTLLSEPEDIVERRSELERRRKRLFSAREELIDVFG
jgi:Dynamin GTPase effector domain